MAMLLRKVRPHRGWRSLVMPEDTASADIDGYRVHTHRPPPDYLKTGLWIVISILSGLAIGQL